jgi:hypothetical protein
MPIVLDQRDRARPTLVGFHDLLGFGELLAASGGTLDSAVGELAYKRVLGLRSSVTDVQDKFPQGTMFFHFNDTVTAYLDVDIAIGSSHTDPSGIAAAPPSRAVFENILRFVSGCANLHQISIGREENDRLGPAGRTFVVLGKRWELGAVDSEQVFEVPPLQANFAFAEAYLADRAGSKHGFSHRTYYRMYLNDYLWFILVAGYQTVSLEKQLLLSALGGAEAFPNNLSSPDSRVIEVEIFHRLRRFYSVMSHHACELSNALDAAQSED